MIPTLTLTFLFLCETVVCLTSIPNPRLGMMSPRQKGQCDSSVNSTTFLHHQAHFNDLRASFGDAATGTWSDAQIDVYWHNIFANETYGGGWLTQEQIATQIQVLNQDYLPAGLSFNLVYVNRVLEADWFENVTDEDFWEDEPGWPSLQQIMKTKLHRGDVETLNIYSVGLQNVADHIALGYSTFPWDYKTMPSDDGIILAWTTLPGGTYPDANLGKTLVHEVGHWGGLLHTFTGNSCVGEGDFVDDTPPELGPNNMWDGCNEKHSCSNEQADPIQNYMDYSPDWCMREFTPGQIERMRLQTAFYRGIGAPNDTKQEVPSSKGTSFIREMSPVMMCFLAQALLCLFIIFIAQ